MVSLAGMQVLVTRPAPEGGLLCDAIHAAGGSACWLPALAIEPVELAAGMMTEKIQQLDSADWLIFVSPRAVRFLFSLIHKLRPALPQGLRVAAVGRGTARALALAGCVGVISPVQDDASQGLLALPVFGEVRGQRVMLVKGAGGLPLLFDALRARGAEVTEWPVYQRTLPLFDDRAASCFARLKQGSIHLTVCASGDGLHNLLILAGQAGEAVPALLQRVPLLVASPRLAALATLLGWQKVLLADGAGQDATMRALAQVVTDNRDKRHSGKR